mmetsp:Transcript_80901/g.135349  ORF Transcript_80901/g.135349 Transcript_80901/m.135349 type:complete len:202 (-) Transcript_80901:5038-5643(-)
MDVIAVPSGASRKSSKKAPQPLYLRKCSSRWSFLQKGSHSPSVTRERELSSTSTSPAPIRTISWNSILVCRLSIPSLSNSPVSTSQRHNCKWPWAFPSTTSLRFDASMAFPIPTAPAPSISWRQTTHRLIGTALLPVSPPKTQMKDSSQLPGPSGKSNSDQPPKCGVISVWAPMAVSTSLRILSLDICSPQARTVRMLASI